MRQFRIQLIRGEIDHNPEKVFPDLGWIQFLPSTHRLTWSTHPLGFQSAIVPYSLIPCLDIFHTCARRERSSSAVSGLTNAFWIGIKAADCAVISLSGRQSRSAFTSRSLVIVPDLHPHFYAVISQDITRVGEQPQFPRKLPPSGLKVPSRLNPKIEVDLSRFLFFWSTSLGGLLSSEKVGCFFHCNPEISRSCQFSTRIASFSN